MEIGTERNRLQKLACQTVGSIRQSNFYHALRTVSEIAYVKCEVLIIVASNRRDEVGLFIFLGDKVYTYSSKRTKHHIYRSLSRRDYLITNIYLSLSDFASILVYKLVCRTRIISRIFPAHLQHRL